MTPNYTVDRSKMVRSTSRQSWQREERDHLTLREILHVLWGRRTLVLTVVIGLVLASLAFSLFRDTVYKAEALVAVEPQGELSSSQDAEVFVNEVFRAVDTSVLRSETIRRTGWSGSESSFEQQMDVQAVVQQTGGEAGLLIQFDAPVASEAAGVANTYAKLFVRRVTQLNERLAGGSVAATASLQSRAVAPESPSSPRPLVYAAIAAGAGLLIGGAAALTIEGRTQSWRGPRDAELTLRAPVLGAIPEYSSEEGDV